MSSGYDERRSLAAVAENVEHAFAEAGRKLGGGLHSAYLNVRAAEDDAPPVPAIKLELYALLQDPAVAKSVEARAGELLTQAQEQHKVAVRALPDERRQHHRHIRRQSARPEPEPWELPDSIEGTKDGNAKLDRHMYVTATGGHACTLNDWERDALKDGSRRRRRRRMAPQRPAEGLVLHGPIRGRG